MIEFSKSIININKATSNPNLDEESREYLLGIRKFLYAFQFTHFQFQQDMNKLINCMDDMKDYIKKEIDEK